MSAATAATSARPAAERDTIVLFPGRDLMTVSLSELADCQFQGEASASLIEVSALNDLRCEATRWHTGATNVEKLIYHLKRLIVELASQESDGHQASDIFPTSPLQEGFMSFSGKSLADLRGELPDLEGRLFHLRAGSSMLAWSYFEKLVGLENMSVDRSEGTSSLSNPMPTSAREVTVESLLDCLVWATNKFGQLSTVIGKVQDAASSMAESSGLVNPKLDAQHTSLLRMSDGILALAANIKVNGEQGAPILAGVKAIQKQLENCAWQVSGSGAKLVNVSVKELLMSQGKNIGENLLTTMKLVETATKSLEIAKNTYEGLVALNDSYKEGTSTMKESNQLLRELIEGQKMALRQPGIRASQQNSPPEPFAPAPAPMGPPGVASVPAAFQAAPLNPTRIPGTILPRPPNWPGVSAEATPSTPAHEEEDPVTPGFKRVKLADGSTMTIPKGWQPDPNL